MQIRPVLLAIPILVLSSANTVFAQSQSSTETYTYDALGRLIKVESSGGSNNGVNQSYAYDDAGNRTNVQVTDAPDGDPDDQGSDGDSGSQDGSSSGTSRRPYFNGLFTIFVSN